MDALFFKFDCDGKHYTIEVREGDIYYITIEKENDTKNYDTSYRVLNGDNKINKHLYNINSSNYVRAVISKDDKDFLYELYDMKLDFISYSNESSYKMKSYLNFLDCLSKDVRAFFEGFKRYDVDKRSDSISGFMDQDGNIVAIRNFYFSGFGNLVNYAYPGNNKDNNFNEYLTIFFSDLYLKDHNVYVEVYNKLSQRFKIDWFKEDIVPRYIYWDR